MSYYADVNGWLIDVLTAHDSEFARLVVAQLETKPVHDLNPNAFGICRVLYGKAAANGRRVGAKYDAAIADFDVRELRAIAPKLGKGATLIEENEEAPATAIAS